MMRFYLKLRPVRLKCLVSEKSKRCQYVGYFSYSQVSLAMVYFFDVNTTKRSCTKYVEMYLENYRKNYLKMFVSFP